MTAPLAATVATSAVSYRQLGLSVFPVARNKDPLVKWKPYQEELPHPDEIVAWWEHWPDASIGVATGKVSGIVVLDADGPEGLESLTSLNTPATTWLSKTGRPEGGWQQFFKHPGAGMDIRNKVGLKPKLDVRGDGGFVIVPPSLHASGRRYEWLTSPTDLPLAPLPETVLQLLVSAEAPRAERREEDGAPIPEGQRNDHLFRLARALLARGLSAQAVLAALLEENRIRCTPPLSDFEVRGIAKHAATQPHRLDFGTVPPAQDALAGRLERPEPIELRDLLRRSYPDDAGLVAGGLIVRRGLVVMGGAPKLGKSSLVLNLVLRRGTGAPWLGYPTTLGCTLVVQAEVPDPELQKRLGLMLKDVDEIPPAGSIYFLTDRSIKLDRPDGLASLRQHIECIRPDLLVVDPLARFMVGDESGTKDMGTFIAALDLLIQDYNLAVVVVHHTGKPGPDGREGGHRLRGSSALFAAADSVLLLDRADDGFKLSFELRHGKEPSPLYLTRTNTLWFTPAGPPEEFLAVAYLVHSGPLRWGQFITAIQQDLTTTKRTAERLLDRTKKAGLVAPDADGYYTATAAYRQIRGGGDVSAS